MNQLKAIWWWLRQTSGDAAYENYLKSAARTSQMQLRGGRCAQQGMSEREFYLDLLERRYNGLSRCC